MATKPTPRQTEILALFAEGYTMRGVARELGISWHTVKSHVFPRMVGSGHSGLLERIGATNITHAVAIALREGWIE